MRYLFKHFVERCQLNISAKEFKILKKGFQNNTIKRRVEHCFGSLDYFPEYFFVNSITPEKPNCTK